jgi:thiol-disulfide isomerase/thioredoxin
LGLAACASAPKTAAKASVRPTQAALVAQGGEPAPAFSLKDQHGRTWSVADSQAKPMLIDLWATWCGPCVQALPDLQRFNNAHSQKVQVLGLAMDIQGWPVVTPVLKRLEVSYPVACAGPDLNKAYGVTSYPYLVVVQQGQIVKRLVGRQNFNDLERELQPWLN